MLVQPMLLHRMALVSFRLFSKNFFGKWFTTPPPPLDKSFPYAYAPCKGKAKYWKLLKINLVSSMEKNILKNDSAGTKF